MRRHFIEQPVSLHEELSHSGLAEFGDHATSLAQGIKGGRWPFLPQGFLNLLVGNGPPSGDIRLPALYRLKNIQVV